MKYLEMIDIPDILGALEFGVYFYLDGNSCADQRAYVQAQV
jgi:hypothetical protein